MLPALLAIHVMEVRVRGGVIRRHWGMVRIVGIKIPTARVHLDAVIRRDPPRIVIALVDRPICVTIRLDSILRARAAHADAQQAE